MATTNVIYEEREDRYSRAGSDDPVDLRRRKEMAAVLYNLVDHNYRLGNIDDKERAHVHGLILKANDLGSFIGCHTEIVNILDAKEIAGKLKDGDAVDDHCDQAYQGLCELDARYKNQPPPPPPAHGARRIRANRPPPPPPATSIPFVLPPPVQAVVDKFKDTVFCAECGEVVAVFQETLCSNCKRKAKRKELSPIKKKITAMNRSLEKREREIAERANMVRLMREKEEQLKEKEKLLTQLMAFAPK